MEDVDKAAATEIYVSSSKMEGKEDIKDVFEEAKVSGSTKTDPEDESESTSTSTTKDQMVLNAEDQRHDDDDDEDTEFELTEETLIVTNRGFDGDGDDDECIVGVETMMGSPVGENKLKINEPPLVYVAHDQDPDAHVDTEDDTSVAATAPLGPLVSNESFFTYNKIRLRIVDTTASSVKLSNNESLALVESFQITEPDHHGNLVFTQKVE